MQRSVWMVGLLAWALGVGGCGKKDDGSEAAGDDKSAGVPEADDGANSDKGGQGAGAAAAGDWNAEAVSFKGKWMTDGEATKSSDPSKLTGTIYVGPEAIRLDIDKHPNVGGPVSFIKPIGEKELWQVNLADRTIDRALSGDWEHAIIPFVVEADDVEDIAKGDCPFGYGKDDDCKQVGSDEVAGRAVQKWHYKSKTYWVDPALRTALKQQYTPYRNNPGVQTVELSDIEVGDQDPAVFTAPAGSKCDSGSFCDSAPIAK